MSLIETRLGGVRALVSEPASAARFVALVLHGFAMTPDDLAPFAESMGTRGVFVFPEGPTPAVPSGRGWWPLDMEARERALAAGPRDLASERPSGVAKARALVREIVLDIGARYSRLPVMLIGFSQGGMLATDFVLRESHPVTALALLSSSRIAVAEWRSLLHRVRGLPVFVAHGRQDADLSFAAGESLRTMFADAGAVVTWRPFEGGHEIPLVVWRELKKFLMRTLGDAERGTVP